MMNDPDVPKTLKPFEFWGVEFTSSSGDEHCGTCLFCHKENHFYANAKVGKWECKRCGECGNIITFLEKIHADAKQMTSDRHYHELDRNRSIPACVFKRFEIAVADGDYIIPCRASTGRIHDLRRWDKRSKTLRSTAGCKVQLFGADRLAKAKAGTPVFICEGEWDAMALDQMLRSARRPGVAVGVPGANTFKAEWAKLFRRRDAYLCYDNDEPGMKGMAKAGAMVGRVAKSLRYLHWPEGAADGFDVRDWYRRNRKTRPIARVNKFMRLFADAHPRPELMGNSSSSSGDRDATDPHEIARVVIDREFRHADLLTLRYCRGRWWRWEGGHYTSESSDDFKARLNRQVRAALDDVGVLDTKVTRTLVENVAQAIGGECLIPESTLLPAWLGDDRPTTGDLLAMKNGLLDLDAAVAGRDDCLLDHTPQWFATTTWDFAYSPTAKCPRWTRFLKQVLPDREHRQLLQEYLGYCLCFDTSLQKFMILVGDGANGKSVVTEVATGVIGLDNVASVGLERFGDRFALAGTIGKLANIVSEIQAVRGVAEDVLKAVVSGERIRVEFKYRTPTDAKPTIRLLFATNELPHFKDRSEGVWRRMMVIPFDVTIPQSRQDRNLARNIIEHERAGVFNWMLRGLSRLRRRGHFIIPDDCKEIVSDQKRDANPAGEFLNEYVCEARNASVAVSVLYGRYCTWCTGRSLRTLTQSEFGKEVHRTYPNATKSQVREGDDRRYYYKGIEMRMRSKAQKKRRRG